MDNNEQIYDEERELIAIEDYLDSNHTIAELEQSLDAICSKTPLSTLCTNLVNSYLPQIITYLEQKESPQTICNQLGFCSTKPSIHYKYDFCNSLFRLYTNLHQNKMYYFSDDCITHDCAKTSVIISHRFSTVRMADRIMVLKNGIVNELGTHDGVAVMKYHYPESKSGEYRKFYNKSNSGKKITIGTVIKMIKDRGGTIPHSIGLMNELEILKNKLRKLK